MIIPNINSTNCKYELYNYRYKHDNYKFKLYNSKYKHDSSKHKLYKL